MHYMHSLSFSTTGETSDLYSDLEGMIKKHLSNEILGDLTNPEHSVKLNAAWFNIELVRLEYCMAQSSDLK